MKILITGIAGFIGSHLADALGDCNEVVGIDNLITGNVKNCKHHNWKLKNVEDRWDVGKVDQIYHLASPASPVAYSDYPLKTMTANSLGTHRVMEYALKHGARVLVASTSEVYGDPLEHPQLESYYGNVNPIGNRSMYDESKRYMEALTMVYYNMGVDTRIARLFNTYGERMDMNDGRVIPNFLKQSEQGEPLTIYGDGTQTRSFCHVEDTVKGLITVMKDGDHLPYNIGNPEEITMNELADLFGGDKQYLAIDKDDPKQRLPDITRIKKLGWQPSINIKEGLIMQKPQYV